MIKFAHFADVHLGAFRDPVLRELNVSAFEKAVDRCIEYGIDFIIIAGDLFEISLPDMAVVNRAVRKMKQLKDAGIPIYLVYGSHDYSATETSVIDVLGSAGVMKKVVSAEIIGENKIQLKFFTDKKTGVKLLGLSARKRGAEKTYYENLDCTHLENSENGNFKIFVFHSTLNEMKPEFLSMSEGIPLSNFPKNFNYYAGGHVHKRMERDFPEYGKFVFPGHLFGRDYRDLENTSKEPGGFYIVEVDDNYAIKTSFEQTDVCSIVSLSYNADGKTSHFAEEEIKNIVENTVVSKDKPLVVLFKVHGELASGKPSEIDFSGTKHLILEKGAITAYINHNALSSRELEQLKVKGEDRHEIEKKLFEEHLGLFEKKTQLKNKSLSGKDGGVLSELLLNELKIENAGESKADYESKIRRSATKILGISGDDHDSKES